MRYTIPLIRFVERQRVMVTADKRKTYSKRSKKVSDSNVSEPAAVYSAEPLSFESA